MHTTLLLLHICSAIVGLLSGFMAMALRKGSSWHGAAGTVFFGSMLSMSASGAYIAAFLKPVAINVVAASLTFYLVATAWRAAKNRAGATGAFDVGALLFALAVGASGWAYGLEARNSPNGMKDGVPVAMYFIFGSIALLFAVSDVRMLMRGGVIGARRIGRHLWRMSLALLIATLSFYPGQAKLFPRAIRATNLLYVPHVLLLGVILLWLYRISVRKRAERKKAAVANMIVVPGTV
jgi:hypothetical protein